MSEIIWTGVIKYASCSEYSYLRLVLGNNEKITLEKRGSSDAMGVYSWERVDWNTPACENFALAYYRRGKKIEELLKAIEELRGGKD